MDCIFCKIIKKEIFGSYSRDTMLSRKYDNNSDIDLMIIFEDYEKMAVACSNREKGAVARKKCDHACIKCHKCEKSCPVGAISFVDNLPVIDLVKCIDCGTCAEVCPVKCIVKNNFIGKNNIDETETV